MLQNAYVPKEAIYSCGLARRVDLMIEASQVRLMMHATVNDRHQQPNHADVCLSYF